MKMDGPMTHPRFDALILNAPLRQSLMAARSLGRRGLRVAAAGTSLDAPIFASRYCAGGFVFPPEEEGDRYLVALERWLDETGARVVIPSHDGTIALLRAHRDLLGRRTRLALASEGALAVAVNKERTLAEAVRLGIRTPRETVIRGPADLTAALTAIGFPAVLKPSESWLGDASTGHWAGPTLVVDADEAARVVDALTGSGGHALFQQYLPGRREAVSFLYAAGKVHARFAQWAERTRPPLGGESVLRQAIPVPEDIGGQAEALIRAIDLEGYSEVEFRRDDAGVPYLMEINPRLSASVEVAVRAGVDFPALLYQWAAGERVDEVVTYRPGGWMRHLGGDVETTLAAVEQRGRPGIRPPARVVMDFALSFFRGAGYDYADWRDPGPAVVASTRFTRALLDRVFSRALRAVS